MKDKKNIIFLIFAIIFFISMLIFVFWVYFSEETNLKNNVASQNNLENEIEIEQIEEDKNKSKTKSIDAEYVQFSVYDKDGNSVSLLDYKDSPVMIVFFNKNNKDSIEFINNIDEVYEKYKDVVNFILIDTENGMNQNYDVQIPIYYDKDKEAVDAYNITELPAMICINDQNEVFNAKVGIPSKDALEANLDILAKNY